MTLTFSLTILILFVLSSLIAGSRRAWNFFNFCLIVSFLLLVRIFLLVF